MTHTYAVLPVPREVYDLVRGKLVAAGYHHALHREGVDEAVDMHGIALQPEPAQAGAPPQGEATIVGVDMGGPDFSMIALRADVLMPLLRDRKWRYDAMGCTDWCGGPGKCQERGLPRCGLAEQRRIVSEVLAGAGGG